MNLFKTKKTESEYPAIVQEIHHEFENFGEKLLAEAKEILAKAESIDIDKGNRLLSLGFTSAKQAKEAVAIQEAKRKAQEQSKLIVDHSVKYPTYKFITDDGVKTICEKYGLVCGPISIYKGFVPENKLQAIEQFTNLIKRQAEEARLKRETEERSVYMASIDPNSTGEERFYSPEGYTHTQRRQMESRYRDMSNMLWGFGSPFGWRSNPDEGKLHICAPEKDMDTTGFKKSGHILKRDIPDPVVLHPVRGGYIIVCAWGDEASDPLVVNEGNN
jgi:hypothetical protein